MKLSKNTIKQEFDSINSIDKFLEKIENNPSLVDNLSEGSLDVLINYYSNITILDYYTKFLIKSKVFILI